jgi:glucokinase
MMYNYIGIDIGGTKCAAVLGDSDGKVLEKVKIPTGSAETTIGILLDASEKMIKESAQAVKSVGISCGGPLDPVRGIIQSPPNLPGWDDIKVTDMFEKRLGIPAYLCNDANACALAEWKFGAGKGTKNMVFLTFGTGMGAGIIIDGKIYNGANGNAGEVGHIRLAEHGPVGYGKEGSFEGFSSGGGIAMLAKTAAIEKLQQGKKTAYCSSYGELDSITAKSVADAARAGDETAVAVYKTSAQMLGMGLSLLVDILNPEVIVIGSIYQRSHDLIEKYMDDVMRRECLTQTYSAVKVLPALLGDEIGDIAALTLAMEGGK